ncbi:hypothetical protein DXT99_00980 [Pontibacter diazotrophicus]|uniref:Uncharacterized protein n=1 Tax=Pontibacter diazotrophicus TaxID=1400979 RepID=A0A3D8LI47_9BACT|nr:hypothetical protein [Pontibacter diazotrophicus]RDV17120.1 hypothetical protein DXT99_00980 [Pontibacter diazotrophicus]
MGKRQERIFRNDIKNRIQELLVRQTVQVVLRSKVVMNGDITKLTDEELHLKDHRFGKHKVAIGEIEEIIYDIEAPY